MKQISDFPRVHLGVLPTPLQKLENMSREFGKQIYLKRDDMTGVALGANKLGMKTILMLKKRGVTDFKGNQILNRVLNAQVEFYDTDSYGDIYEEMARRKAELAGKGQIAYEIPVGGSTALGALGYVECFRETMEQCHALGIHPDRMVGVVGSGGTYAGLCAGADLFAPEVKVTGMAVDDDPFEQITAQLKLEIGALMELDQPLTADNIEIYYNCGAGYGIPGPEDGDAVRYLARTEGIILDPVYTGKGFSRFLRMLREGAFDDEQTIIFLHSGGAGGLFAIDLPE